MANISESIVRKDNLSLIKTNKYKDISIYVKCGFEFDEKHKAALSILCGMLNDTCKKYPTKQEMLRQRDMLYGLNYQCSINNVSDITVFSFYYSFLNPRFVSDVDITDYIGFIDETLHHPNLNEEAFLEAKKIIIDETRRRLDNPGNLAIANFMDELIRDDANFKPYQINTIKTIEKIRFKDVVDAYDSLFKSRVDVFLIGDFQDELVSYFKGIKSQNNLKLHKHSRVLDSRKELNERKETKQSNLIVAYSSPYVKKESRDYYAFLVGNVLFGGIPSSLLFSEVREKDSLCYSIYAKSYRYEGVVCVVTSIDNKNKEKALKDIRNQYARMVNKDYDVELLDMAKAMLINNSLTMNDDLEYLTDYAYAAKLDGRFIPCEDLIKRIMDVTTDDIARVFRNYREYLVYYLEGSVNE